MADTDARQDDDARADPNVVFDNDGRRRRHHVMPLEVVLVVVQNEGVMTKQAVAANSNPFVRRNG
jgi:hypothetical protein